MIGGEVLIISFLILLNGFFAMSEMAIVSASKPLLKQMAKTGNKGAALAVSLAEDSGKLFSVTQIGVTLITTLAGAYGGDAIAGKLEAPFNEIAWIAPHGKIVAFVLVVSVITFFSVVIGELVPKQIAIRRPEAISIFAARPMAMIALIAKPVVWLLDRSAETMMRLLGLFEVSSSHVTEAEVKAVLAEGAESGILDKEEHDMLQRVIRLDDRDVASIMTHRTDVVQLDASDSFSTVKAAMAAGGHARYPVADGNPDNIIGVIQAKALVGSSAEGFSLRNYLEPVASIPERASALKALEIFKIGDVHLALVVSEYGTVKGIVTAADLLEAIVGIVPSNYDGVQHARIRARDDGSYLVDGVTVIDELELTLGIDGIEAGDFHTVAGFLLKHLGKTPEEGDMVESHGWRFEIVDMDGMRIDKLLVTPLDGETAAPVIHTASPGEPPIP